MFRWGKRKDWTRWYGWVGLGLGLGWVGLAVCALLLSGEWRRWERKQEPATQRWHNDSRHKDDFTFHVLTTLSSLVPFRFPNPTPSFSFAFPFIILLLLLLLRSLLCLFVFFFFPFWSSLLPPCLIITLLLLISLLHLLLPLILLPLSFFFF